MITPAKNTGVNLMSRTSDLLFSSYKTTDYQTGETSVRLENSERLPAPFIDFLMALAEQYQHIALGKIDDKHYSLTAGPYQFVFVIEPQNCAVMLADITTLEAAAAEILVQLTEICFEKDGRIGIETPSLRSERAIYRLIKARHARSLHTFETVSTGQAQQQRFRDYLQEWITEHAKAAPSLFGSEPTIASTQDRNNPSDQQDTLFKNRQAESEPTHNVIIRLRTEKNIFPPLLELLKELLDQYHFTLGFDAHNQQLTWETEGFNFTTAKDYTSNMRYFNGIDLNKPGAAELMGRLKELLFYNLKRDAQARPKQSSTLFGLDNSATISDNDNEPTPEQ